VEAAGEVEAEARPTPAAALREVAAVRWWMQPVAQEVQVVR
jgi:hypothetical protein